MKKRRLTSGLVVLRREIFSQADEKMMERFREIADPSVTSSEGGDQSPDDTQKQAAVMQKRSEIPFLQVNQKNFVFLQKK